MIESENEIVRWYLLSSTTPSNTEALLQKYMSPVKMSIRHDFKLYKGELQEAYKKRKADAKAEGRPFAEEFVAPKLPTVREVFVPHKFSVYNHTRNKTYMLNRYVYVKASLASLKTISDFDTKINIEYDSSRQTPVPICADDNAIRIVKFALEYGLRAELLQNYQRDTTWFDYVVLKLGEDVTENISGRVANIGRNGMKLMFKLFNWRLLLPDIKRWNLKIVSNNASRLGRDAALARQVDYFLEKLKGHNYNNYGGKLSAPVKAAYASNAEAPKILRALLVHFGDKQALQGFARDLAQTISKNSTSKDLIKYTFLSSFTMEDYNRFWTLAMYLRDLTNGRNVTIYSRPNKDDGQIQPTPPKLKELIPDIPFRSFLTTTADINFPSDKDYYWLPEQNSNYQEYIFRTEILEGSWKGDTKEMFYTKQPYFANVVLIHDYEGSRLLFVSCRGLYEDVMENMTAQDREFLYTRLKRIHADKFYEVLQATQDRENTDSIQLFSLTKYNTSGLGLRLKEGMNTISNAQRLIEYGITVCKEIMGAVQLRNYQQILSNAWLRHTYEWEKTDAEIFEHEREKVKTKKEKDNKSQAHYANKFRKHKPTDK